MAISQSDGSLILTMKVDDSGLKQGIKNLKSEAAKLAAEYRKAGMSQSEAFKKAWSEIKKTTTETEKATKLTKKYGEQAQKTGNSAKNSFNDIGNSIKKFASTIGLTLSIAALINFSKESAAAATQQEANIQRIIDIYGEASEKVSEFIEKSSKAIGMSKSAATSTAATYGNLLSVWADVETNATLTNALLNQTAVVATKTGRTVTDVAERIRSGLLGNTEAIEDLGINVNIKTIEITEAFQRIADGRSWEQLNAYEQSQIRTLAILEQSTKKYGTQVSETTALTKSEFSAAYQDFMVAWGNFVNIVLVPILKVLTKIISYVTVALNVLLGLNGDIIGSTEGISSSVEETTKNQKDLTQEVKNTQKEQKKSLALFDELMILSSGGISQSNLSASDTIIAIPDDVLESYEKLSEGIDNESLEELKEFEQWMIDNKDNIETALDIAGIAGLTLGIGKLIEKISSLFGFFDNKNKKLKKQTKLTKNDGLAVESLAWALSAVLGGALIGAKKLLGDSNQELDNTSGSLVTAKENSVSFSLGLQELATATKNSKDETNKFNEELRLLPESFNVLDPFLVGSKEKQENLSESILQTKDSMEKVPEASKKLAESLLPTQKKLIEFTYSSYFAESGFDMLVEKLKDTDPIEKLGIAFDTLSEKIKNWATNITGAKDKYKDLKNSIMPRNETEASKQVNEIVNPQLEIVAKALEKQFTNQVISQIEFGIASAQESKVSKNTEIARKILGDPYFSEQQMENIEKISETYEANLKVFLENLAKAALIAYGLRPLPIPGLAKGAVIPPNRKFLAVLGDQTSGTNIEAPLSTIKQAVREELTGYGGLQTDVTVNFTGTEARLIRYLAPKISKSSKYRGKNLITGGTL